MNSKMLVIKAKSEPMKGIVKPLPIKYINIQIL